MDTIDYSEEISFQKYWLVLKRRWLLIALISSGLLGLSALYVLTKAPVYEAVGKLLFKSDKTSTLVGIKSDSGQLEAVTGKSDPLSTQAELLRSLSIARETIEALNLTDNQGKRLTPKAFSNLLIAKPVVGTDILQVTYKAKDPELAARVVNQVMQAYLKNNVTFNRKEAVSAKKFIVEQLPETEKAVNQAEANLRQFKEANGIVALEQEASATVTGLSTLDKDITDTQAELTQANARTSELRSQVGMDAKTALAIAALNQSENVQKALTEIQQVRAKLAKQRTIYSPKHPEIDLLQRQETAARGVLQGQITEIVGANLQVPNGKLQIGTTAQSLVVDLAKAEVERFSLAQRLQALARSQSAYVARSQSLPALEKTQRELERQLDAAQTTYKTLLTKLQEVQVAENQAVGNATVVSAAEVQPEPVDSKMLLYLAVGGVAGLLIGIATAFLVDYSDRSVKTLREAKELFQYTLLGVIPTVGDSERAGGDQAIPQVISRDRPSFAAQEAYQMLHANLRFLTSDKQLKSIVVTSSVRKEGKSTIAANLATAMSQVQRRVLLVDADLRYPCQHHVWNLLNQVGLSNLIVGQVEFQNAVQVITPHLHVITSGVLPPNPLALLDSKRMASLIEFFAQDYDLVIFDVPALSGTADATVLNKMTDGSLLVVRPGVINVADGEAAKHYLAQSDQTVLGMVVNHFDTRNEPDSYFYYNKEMESTAQSEQHISVSNSLNQR